MALAENTKSQYRTAAKHIERCALETGMDMSIPFTVEKTLNYVGYLLESRKVSSNTANQYLSAVRMLHLCNGYDCASLRAPIVALILKGRAHWDNVQRTLAKKPQRVAVTLPVMKYIKRRLRSMDWSPEKKLRVWACCTLLWGASLRVHELLPREKYTFDKQVTLLMEDLEVIEDTIDGKKVEIIRIHLKSPKELRIGTGVKIEIFANQSFLCPAKALKKWLSEGKKKLQPGCPVFRTEDGHCYTGAMFNKDLSEITSPLTDGTDGVIKPHSFRAGLATEMGKHGFSDQEIKQQVCL